MPTYTTTSLGYDDIRDHYTTGSTINITTSTTGTYLTNAYINTIRASMRSEVGVVPVPVMANSDVSVRVGYIPEVDGVGIRDEENEEIVVRVRASDIPHKDDIDDTTSEELDNFLNGFKIKKQEKKE